MISTFFLSFRLKNAYRVNSILYSLKQLPIIKRILPEKLYGVRGLKILGNIISAIWEFIMIFVGKFLYIAFMIAAILGIYQTNSAATFLHIFFFLTICGGLMNTYLFDPTKDKYYAMFLMNMDAKEYTISNYLYQMIKVLIGFLPFTCFYGMSVGLPLWIMILCPIFVMMVKTFINSLSLIDFKCTKKVKNENLPTSVVWILLLVLLVCAYALPYISIVMPTWLFLIFFGLSLGLGIFGFYQIFHFPYYRFLYKQLLTNAPLVIDQTSIRRDASLSQIELDTSLNSTKEGFSYFHELFVKRHRKILTKAIKKQTIVLVGIAIVMSFLVKVNASVASTTNHLMLVFLPYFVFIMYMLNRGTTLTQAMFMNCDHAMLSYRIYRKPNVILGLFKERLKTLIGLNLIPATVIGFTLALLLFLSGGTSNVYNYFVLFFSILAMSVFFSVHYLVMYYLLQPYNVHTEMKSSTYSVVQGVTYFVCYYMMQLRLPTFYFGLSVTAFCILYSLLSLWFAYRLAPKTFKLRA
ncbi:MAG: hypothetical protein SOZ06_03225 [Candidatus Faecenecus gallistercoris]|nr:hypothetical protein [Bacillota bacterium]MDY4050959.1 hypothetical protein [Candidatus Faecenecus gallistercoris]